jgi:glycosyltransferase involved in cell wall biosynthesis
MNTRRKCGAIRGVDLASMNVLVVSVHFPFPPRSGVTMRTSELLRQLASRHEVTLLSYAEPDDLPHVAAAAQRMQVRTVARRSPSRWRKRAAQLVFLGSARPFSAREVQTPELQAALDALCAEQAFDVIQLEGSLLCDLRLPPEARIVLDEHNIEYEVFERMRDSERSLLRRAFHAVEARRFRRFERAAWSRTDACVVTSPREQPVVRAAVPGLRTAVVPNGVDVERFAPVDDRGGPPTLVFNGTLEYRPNVDAAQHLVDEVWPLVRERCPEARLHIVGRTPAALARRLQGPGVTVTGEVPDVRPWLEGATVIAVPIRMGGGTRLKVLEALALGKAMVSSTLGCEGIAVRHGEHLLVADSAEEFAARVHDLFLSARLRRHLGRQGRRLAEQLYTWDIAGERLEALYRSLDGVPELAPA